MGLLDFIKNNSTLNTTLDLMRDNRILSYTDKISISLTINFKNEDFVYKKEGVMVGDINIYFNRKTVKEAKTMLYIIEDYLLYKMITNEGYEQL